MGTLTLSTCMPIGPNGQPEPDDGPALPAMGQVVERWRRLERKRDLTADEERAYGRAVLDVIRRDLARRCDRVLNAGPHPCISGIARDCTGAEVMAAVRVQQARALANWRSDERDFARNSPAAIRERYAAAMAEKRAALGIEPPTPAAAPAPTAAPRPTRRKPAAPVAVSPLPRPTPGDLADDTMIWARWCDATLAPRPALVLTPPAPPSAEPDDATAWLAWAAPITHLETTQWPLTCPPP